MSVEIQSIKIDHWYLAAAGQYRRVLNLDHDGKITYELLSSERNVLGTFRASVESFAKAVDRPIQCTPTAWAAL